MKFNIYYIALCIWLITTMGCKKDFLQLAPISNANVDNFYKTPADINNAVIAAYKFHKQVYSTSLAAQAVLDEVRSDNTTLTGLDPVDRFIPDTGKEWYGWSWDACYKAIYMCNLAIEKAQGVEMSDAQRNQYIGEAMFLRAITYFELVRNFGGVPLIVSTPKSFDAESVNVPKNTAEEVYSQIITDLKTAGDGRLPDSYGDADVGRATKGAAQGMLGKVYLTVGDKGNAKTILTEVVNSENYHLLDTYAEVFDVDSRNSPESLFELQFKAVTDGAPFQTAFTSQAATIPGGGLGYNIATEDLVDDFESGDLRKNLMKADPNEVYYTIKYDDPGMTSANNSSHNFPILRYSDVLLMLAEATGESDESYDLINEVRDRAGLGSIDASTPGTFEEKLLHERRVELAFENHRWHDLLRFGVAIPVMNNALTPLGITIDQDDLLMPIPQTAMSTNPNLVQNDGY